MEKIKSSSPFCTFAEKKAYDFKEREYISYIEVEKVADGYDPKNPHAFLIEKEVIEDQRVPIDDEINAHRNKVGLKNLLKGIVDQRQMKDLISRTQRSSGFIDATKIPDSHLEIEALAGKLEKVWDEIPDDLKKGLTKEEFLKTISSQKIYDYASKVAANSAASKKKEGE